MMGAARREDKIAFWYLHRADRWITTGGNSSGTACLLVYTDESAALAALRHPWLAGARLKAVLASRVRSVLLWGENRQVDSVVLDVDPFDSERAHESLTILDGFRRRLESILELPLGHFSGLDPE